MRIAGTLAVVYTLILRPLIVLSVVAFAIMVYTDSPVAIALVTLALLVTLIWCLLVEYIKYSFGEYPAVFEGIFYRAAAERSRFLVYGRRWWLFFVLIGWGTVLYLFAAILTEVIPRLVGWPDPGLTTVMGVLRVAYRSFALNICLAFFFVFQTLLYFRLRREKHDLTFFDLSTTDSNRARGQARRAHAMNALLSGITSHLGDLITTVAATALVGLVTYLYRSGSWTKTHRRARLFEERGDKFVEGEVWDSAFEQYKLALQIWEEEVNRAHAGALSQARKGVQPVG